MDLQFKLRPASKICLKSDEWQMDGQIEPSPDSVEGGGGGSENKLPSAGWRRPKNT